MTGVLVLGGTGKTGSALAELLRGDGVPVRIASRNPPATVPDAVRFDWDDPATHPAALRGMDRVYLVPPTDTVDPMPLVGPFLAEAERLGVRRVVLLGSAIVLPNAPSALRLAARVRARPGWVVLRASGFMQNFLRPHPLGEQIRRHGEIRTAAGDGRLGWIDTRDIAATAAALLTDPGTGPGTGPGTEPGDQRDYLLTGPKALSYQDAAALITARTGRSVRVVHIGADEQAANHRAAGMPAEFAAALAAVEDGIRAGREDQVSTAVLDLTGRPPRPFAEFVRDHAARWGGR
ncbi:NAD(P)H-binding protein [Streptomyces sp. N2-109]|uniref:NAD(P)H-binding protein n=1 Tax=Streptomyces gossypii TaxID=2883101 RepID=A0ABT2K180_9ACTN|nr:NAD(P)H-binding protein [Streptomyces gossypii]MCT2593008.1 NAD(P)H-binding protein [Streptomyces gossypii]MCT2593741.1 NAD(P)H-binding protein [Streptomyces gossypii]